MDTAQHSGEREKISEPVDDEKMMRPHPVGFARRHPVITVLGAATIGLFGGVELAAGVLLGAGVLAALRPRRDRAGEKMPEMPMSEHDERGFIDRVKPEVMARAKAIVQAARGKPAPIA